jgi:hypothetical protein
MAQSIVANSLFEYSQANSFNRKKGGIVAEIGHLLFPTSYMKIRNSQLK